MVAKRLFLRLRRYRGPSLVAEQMLVLKTSAMHEYAITISGSERDLHSDVVSRTSGQRVTWLAAVVHSIRPPGTHWRESCCVRVWRATMLQGPRQRRQQLKLFTTSASTLRRIPRKQLNGQRVSHLQVVG